jgi:hypothetical protein
VDLKDPKFGKRLKDSNKTVVKTMENAFQMGNSKSTPKSDIMSDEELMKIP